MTFFFFGTSICTCICGMSGQFRVHATKTIRGLNASFNILSDENTIVANNDVALHMPRSCYAEDILDFGVDLHSRIPFIPHPQRPNTQRNASKQTRR